MTAPRPIETNFSDSQGQQITNATRRPINPIDMTRYVATMGGPFAVEMAARQTGGYNTQGASIVSAAVNASAGGGLGTYSTMGMSPYAQTGYGYNSLPVTAASTGEFRGSGVTRQTAPALPIGDSPIDLASAQIQQGDMEFSAFFGLQQAAQRQTLKWTALSNMDNQIASAKANILRNFKV